MSPDRRSCWLAGRPIGDGMPPFIVAEIGLNHGGSRKTACELVDAAAIAGADAIKLQTLVASELVAPACPAPAHVAATSLVEFFQQFELDQASHREVIDRAHTLGLAAIATPLSENAVGWLDELGIDGFKIASGDLTWDQLIARAAATGKPVLMSTGMATLDEVRHAIDVARHAGAANLALMHCVSAYPVPAGSENLLAIRTLADACGVPVGLSDHGADTFALPLAVALGASLYERHLVLEGDSEAVDRAVSSTPAELARSIRDARRAWSALGSGCKVCLDVEAVNVAASRRSLCAARSLSAGTILQARDVVALRPGTGIAPGKIGLVIGRRLLQPIEAGDLITLSALEPLPLPEADCVA